VLPRVVRHCAVLQKLPPCRKADRAAVDGFALEWHLEHYNMEADIQARDGNPEIQHLSFLYGVRKRGSLEHAHTVVLKTELCVRNFSK
jgi:hypothetical protein